MNTIILLPVILAFMTTFLVSPILMRWFKSLSLTAIDQQKKGKPLLPTSHGVAIFAGIFIGVFLSIFFIEFTSVLFELDTIPIMAAMLSIMTIVFIGFLDDLNAIKKVLKKDVSGDKLYKTGLPRLFKALSVLPAAIPLMAVQAGVTYMVIPFIGMINLGMIYTLFLIPLAVLCVSNAYNMLAGLNGMEAGMGAVALSGLGIYALTIGSLEASLISFIGAASCIAILYYSWTPSKFLPGDSATYLIGGTIAATVIIGDMEMFGAIIFIPWIVEAFIKLSKKFKATNLGKLVKGKYLKPKNGKIESLTHVIMSSGNFTEKQIVSIFMLIETVIVITAFFIV